MNKKPHQLSRTKIAAQKFIELEEISWQGSDGVIRKWDVAERVGRLEAVMIIARLMPSKSLVLVKQYRPPVDNFIYEFPAGIIDKGESVENTAIRELAEETGYKGEIISKTPPTYNTPGLTGESVYQIFMDIDEALPENQNACATPDDGEHIEVVVVEESELINFCEEKMNNGELFDSKVIAYMQGIKHAQG